ncbi:MAG: hypothetical protein P4L46_17880 [Fimbriimonas sp.]|nr:hypothetical protein [Fimbriimonas sp.]
MTRRILTPLAMIAAMVATIPLAGAQQTAPNAQTEIGGLLISPLLQRVVVKAGQTADLRFTADNPRQIRETATFEVLSFTMEDWTYHTVYGADNPRDCSTWFDTKTQDVQVDPGQRKDIHLKLSVPRGSDGTYWCMLKVTPRPDGSVTKSSVMYEIPIVLIAGKNVKPALRVSTPTLTRMPGAKSGYLATLPVESIGDGFTTIGAFGSLRSMPSGRIVNEFRLDDRNLMPQTKRNISFLVPILPDGQYRMQFRAISGTRSLDPIVVDYVVSKGQATLQTEAATMEQTPVTIEPSSINLSIPRGGNRSINVKVTNNGQKAIAVSLSAGALDQNIAGAIGISESTTSLGMDVQIDNDPDPIEPGETRSVHISMAVPDAASGDIWFALVAKEAGNAKALAESSYCSISVPTTQKPELVVENPFIIKDGAKSVAIKYQIRNSGNTALRPDPTAAVLEGGVRLMARIEVGQVGDGGILPGRFVENTIMLPQGLKPGNHVVEVDYQYGPTAIAKLRVPITIVASQKAQPKAKTAQK